MTIARADAVRTWIRRPESIGSIHALCEVHRQAPRSDPATAESHRVCSTVACVRVSRATADASQQPVIVDLDSVF